MRLSRFTRQQIQSHGMQLGHIPGENPRKQAFTSMPGVSSRKPTGRVHMGMSHATAPLKHQMVSPSNFGIEGPEEGLPP
jgi:hypothetical protein